jgi:hypothetical protein
VTHSSQIYYLSNILPDSTQCAVGLFSFKEDYHARS